MKNLVILLLSVMLFSFSCERANNGSSKEEKETKADVVKKEMDLIQDSVNTAWTKMMASDDQKFKDIKRLLDEISYTDKYNVVMHDSLVKKIDYVKSKRFDETIDLNAMDAYDAITDQFILEVLKFKEKTPGIEQHPIADELITDINYANSPEQVVQYRKNYDTWAKRYNAYLRKNKKQLEKLGEPYASLKERAEIIR